MTFFKGILVGLSAFAVSLFLFYLATLFGGKTADFILYSRYGRFVGVFSSFVLAFGWCLRTRRISKARTASTAR
jgi:hypothetical protein